jgi:Flp pilus assembly protein TadD
VPESADKLKDRTLELAILEGVLARDPQDAHLLGTLATLYTELGLVEKGLELDIRHVALTPDDPGARYDLACSLSLSGRLDEALAELEKALSLGFENTAWMMEDPDLAAVRADARWTVFAEQHRIETAL